MLFNFNIWSSLLLIGFVQGIVYATILWIRSIRTERVSDRLASLILLIGTLYIAQWMLGFAGWYDARDQHTTFMFYFPWRNLWFLGPLVWFYFSSLTNVDFTWHKKHWLHFIPAIIMFMHTLYPAIHDLGYEYVLSNQKLDYFYGTRGSVSESRNANTSIFMQILFILEKIYICTYLYITLQAYKRYRRYIRQEFSNTDVLTFNPLHWWILIFAIGMVLTLILEVFGNFLDFSYQGSWVHYFSMSIIVYISGFLFLSINPYWTRKLHFNNTSSATEPNQSQATLSPESKKPEPKVELDGRLIQKLETSISRDHAYTRPELSLSELAKELGTNPSVLSKLINTQYQVNFNDFINGHRSSAVKASIDRGRHKELTFLSLAIEAGFNSKSTFNRAFKKKYGQSPGEYVKSINEV